MTLEEIVQKIPLDGPLNVNLCGLIWLELSKNRRVQLDPFSKTEVAEEALFLALTRKFLTELEDAEEVTA